jgi:hypothetical protein
MFNARVALPLGALLAAKTANLPVRVDVPHFLRRDAVCMHDGPGARIAFAAKNHAQISAST